MARILLLANLNADHVVKLSSTLEAGKRHSYRDTGVRLGGGAANTGVALAWDAHDVHILTHLGQDTLSTWLIEKAQSYGINCDRILRFDTTTFPTLILQDPYGERTILRAEKAPFILDTLTDYATWDLIYANHRAQNLETWLKQAVKQTRVVCQLKMPFMCSSPATISLHLMQIRQQH